MDPDPFEPGFGVGDHGHARYGDRRPDTERSAVDIMSTGRAHGSDEERAVRGVEPYRPRVRNVVVAVPSFGREFEDVLTIARPRAADDDWPVPGVHAGGPRATCW